MVLTFGTGICTGSYGLPVLGLMPFGCVACVGSGSCLSVTPGERSALKDLTGVTAKYDRALEQTEALHKEILTLGKEPHPFGCLAEEDKKAGRYVFSFRPRWFPDPRLKWGAVAGEIVHDHRSALDQLVCRLVEPPAEVGREHHFPVCKEEPPKGFEAFATRAPWRDKRGNLRNGPLYGVNPKAVAVIEHYQPYNGGGGAVLGRLHDLWNLDKHQALIPTTLIFPAATAHVENVEIIDRKEWVDGDTYVVEILVVTPVPPNASVDVEPHSPTDVLLPDDAEGMTPLIDLLTGFASAMIEFIAAIEQARNGPPGVLRE